MSKYLSQRRISMTKKIAIIGGGVVGATAAFYLSQDSEFDVTLFDEGIGQGTSAAAGIISPWLSKRRNKDWYEMVKLGAAFYPDFLSEVLAGEAIPKSVYQQVGTLLFTKKDKTLDELLKIGQKRREDAPEIGDLTILDRDEIRELVPIYTGDKRGLLASGGARVDGKELVDLLVKTASENGVAFISEKATMREAADGHWSVQAASTNETFDTVILATAAWLPEMLEPFGMAVDIRPQKGQLVELQTDWQTNDWPVIMPAGEKDIIPFLDGKILIGATHEDDAGYDLNLEDHTLREMLENAQQQFSTLFDADDIVTGRVGTRAYTSDYAPFFGEVPGMENVFTASGLGSTGLTAGPIVGYALTQMVRGEKPVLDPANYPIDQYIQLKSVD